MFALWFWPPVPPPQTTTTPQPKNHFNINFLLQVPVRVRNEKQRRVKENSLNIMSLYKIRLLWITYICILLLSKFYLNFSARLIRQIVTYFQIIRILKENMNYLGVKRPWFLSANEFQGSEYHLWCRCKNFKTFESAIFIISNRLMKRIREASELKNVTKSGKGPPGGQQKHQKVQNSKFWLFDKRGGRPYFHFFTKFKCTL